MFSFMSVILFRGEGWGGEPSSPTPSPNGPGRKDWWEGQSDVANLTN